MQVEFKEELGRGKEGVVALVVVNGVECVCKQFKPKKSLKKIHVEADLQRMAHLAGISPKILHIDDDHRRIYMEYIPFSLVELCQQTQGGQLSRDQEEQITQTMNILDHIGVLHNDGNVHNWRVDYSGKLYLLDYGMSKKINAAILRDWGNHPNSKTTLFMMKRSFKHNNIIHTL